MAQKQVIDLFSGLGGWTEAFIEDPTWQVNRYDNNTWLREVPETEIVDLKDYVIATAYKPKLVVASPPCYEFSLAFNAPRAKASRSRQQYYPEEGIELVKRAIQNIQSLNPETWVLENVIGSIPYISELLGEPRQIIGPWVLWGNFPLFNLSRETKKRLKIHKKLEGDKHRHSELRSNHRARIPIELSRNLKLNIDAPSLKEWM